MSEAINVVFNKDFLPLTMGIRDAGLLAEIYREYLANLQQLMLLCGDGLLDHDKLFIEVHKLKSSSASVGAQYLSEKLAEVEGTLLAGRDYGPLLGPLLLVCRQTLDVIGTYAESLSDK